MIFCYISTSLSISSNVHISSGCKIIGGKSSSVIFGEFSTLSPNVVLAAGSDDYLSGIATPMVSPEFKANSEIGTIDIGRHCIIGSNSYNFTPLHIRRWGSSWSKFTCK